MNAPYPHERRVQRFAVLGLVAALALGALVTFRDDTALFGVELPFLAPLALLALGGVAGFVAIARRQVAVALVAAALLALAVMMKPHPEPGLGGYALGLLFAAAVLVFAETVHMTTRYERAHRAVETEGVPEEHINRVTDEALKTLGARAGLAALGVAAGVALAHLLGAAGPRALRASAETTAPLGVAVATLLLLAIAGTVVLVRGARFRFRRTTSPPPQEAEPHVAE